MKKTCAIGKLQKHQAICLLELYNLSANLKLSYSTLNSPPPQYELPNRINTNMIPNYTTVDDVSIQYILFININEFMGFASSTAIPKKQQYLTKINLILQINLPINFYHLHPPTNHINNILIFIQQYNFEFKMLKQQNKSHLQSYSKIDCHKNESPFRDMSTTCFEHKQKSQYLKQFTNILRPQRSATQTNSQLIFQPVIHQLPLELYPQQQSQHNLSKQQLFQRLIQNNTQKIRDRLSAKLEQENKQLQSCTFQPSVSEFTIQNNQNVFDRLYDHAQERQQSLINQQKQKQQQQETQIQQKLAKNHSKFLNKEKHDMAPLHQRLNDIIRKKLQNQKIIEQKHQQDLSFKPEVNQNSKNILENNIEKQKTKKDVVERLLAEYKKSQESKENLKKKFEALQQQKLTFKPNINSNLIKFTNQSDSTLSKAEKCEHDSPQFTFVPKINYLSDLIVKHNRGEEEEAEKLFRLAYEPLQQKQQSVDQIAKEAYSKCTFNPEINQISSTLNAKPRSHNCHRPQQQTYTFKPEINPKSRLIRSGSLQTARLKQSKRIQKFKYDQEYEKLKQCTFKPKINNYRHKGMRELGEVQGMPSFFDKIDKIRSMKELKKVTQDKVFNFEKKYDKRMGIAN